ncbi:hypothetical protein [Lacihabitans lacunae]|uniref:Transposase IS200-like domain-containing protein n=1 Tax=Lacihabitans lacunae TaxID=1028214 RepID=A0ABV7YSQ6_9BACT
MGQIAEKYWYEIPEHFPFVKLEAFVIMPNHVHGIIVIDNTNEGMAANNSDNAEKLILKSIIQIPPHTQYRRPTRASLRVESFNSHCRII